MQSEVTLLISDAKIRILYATILHSKIKITFHQRFIENTFKE